jgi:hypothetical protein
MASTFTVAKLQGFSKAPAVIVLLTIIFIYTMYMNTFLVPWLHQQNGIPPGGVESENVLRNYSKLRWNESTVMFCVLHYFTVWFLISYMRVVFTAPGFVPKAWNKMITDEVLEEYISLKKVASSSGLFMNLITKETYENFNFMDEEFKQFLARTGRKFCQSCRMFKPVRAHHCRQTGRCVLKMDHYCNWISTCIGYANYKYFLLFILYTSIPRLT